MTDPTDDSGGDAIPLATRIALALREPGRWSHSTTADRGYELLDVGDGRRLERFGPVVVDRPAPGADGPRFDPGAWSAADARFERSSDGRGAWQVATARGVDPGRPWELALRPLRFELRLAAGGQVGIFPEHLALASAVASHVRAQARTDDQPAILNLFAYTGALTIASALAGAAVTHVDASRTAVAWARRNAELSDAASCPVRWIVDDAEAVARREGTRGRKVRGVVLDPPSYAHAKRGRRWTLAERLDPLLERVAGVLARPGFLLLTSHTADVAPERLVDAVERTLGGGWAGVHELALPARSGARLRAGIAVSWESDS